MTLPLILASASPARLHLLEQIGIQPARVCPADVDETPLPAEKPRDYVLRVAVMKAQVIAAQHGDAVVLAADTAASIGRKIYGKPQDEADAKRMIKEFSGRRHIVQTGLCVIAPDGKKWQRVVETTVKFCPLSEAEICDYLATDEWVGKAGAFGIQGRGSGFIHWVRGSVSSVVGLPLVETRHLLKAAEVLRV